MTISKLFRAALCPLGVTFHIVRDRFGAFKLVIGRRTSFYIRLRIRVECTADDRVHTDYEALACDLPREPFYRSSYLVDLTVCKQDSSIALTTSYQSDMPEANHAYIVTIPLKVNGQKRAAIRCTVSAHQEISH